MATEYAIFNDRGEQFGLPARTYTTRDAAQKMLDYIDGRRTEMKKESTRALVDLNTHTGWDNETASCERDLRETVQRWEVEKDRTYTLLKREVGPWAKA